MLSLFWDHLSNSKNIHFNIVKSWRIKDEAGNSCRGLWAPVVYLAATDCYAPECYIQKHLIHIDKNIDSPTLATRGCLSCAPPRSVAPRRYWKDQRQETPSARWAHCLICCLTIQNILTKRYPFQCLLLQYRNVSSGLLRQRCTSPSSEQNFLKG